MSDELQHLFERHDRYKFSKSNMYRTVSDVFPIDEAKLFKTDKVEKVIRELVDEEVDDNMKYNPKLSRELCRELSEKVRSKIKEFNFERYKITCLVQIFEKQNHSILSVARLLADNERDRYCVINKETNSFYLIVSAFGLYYP